MPSRIFSAIVYVALFGSAAMKAHSQEELKWEVISVKPMSPASCDNGAGGGVRYLSNGLSASCVPLIFTLEFAYHMMDPARFVGLPKWALGQEMYAMEARVSAEDAPAFNKLKRDEKAGMMKSVFTERFGLKAHLETREMPAYTLVVAKGGTKMKLREPADTTSGRSEFGSSNGEVKWINSPLGSLMFLLAKETGRPVVDDTGLTGKYDFTLEYGPSARAAADESVRPSIFTALEEQLGLKLVASKQKIEVLVVDSIAQPSEN